MYLIAATADLADGSPLLGFYFLTPADQALNDLVLHRPGLAIWSQRKQKFSSALIGMTVNGGPSSRRGRVSLRSRQVDSSR